MAMKKALCCMSTRMGTLIFLYLFLIGEIWGIISSFSSLGDSIYKEFLKNNGFICWANVLAMLIGGSLFLAAIVSITNNTPSILMLNCVIGFLPLEEILSIYAMFCLTSNGTFDKLFDAEIEKQIKDLRLDPSLQDEFRTLMKSYCQVLLNLVYFSCAMSVLIVMYAILVFHGYKTELKENSVVAPASRNVNDKEANFAEPPAYNFQFTAPQHPLKPMQYSA